MSVAIQHGQERREMVPLSAAFLPPCGRTVGRKSAKGLDGPMQEFPELSAGLSAFIAGKPLRCVRQHELVTLLDGLKAIPYVCDHILRVLLRSSGSRPRYLHFPPLRVVVFQVELAPHRA